MQPESPRNRALLHEKLDALLDECDLVSQNAEYGQTFDDMEEFFLIKGRKFLQETFQEKLQERIDHTDAALEGPPCPNCKKKRTTKTKEPNTSSPSTVR